MKKAKNTKVETLAAPETPSILWWPWAVAALALFVAFEVFGPGLKSAFVLDDLYLPYGMPEAARLSLRGWLASPRPLLALTYYLNYQISAADPYSYHLVNILLHVGVSGLIAWITHRILQLANVTGGRLALSLFSGVVFLLHPLQTESVVYVASRSEVLSVLFFMAALALFLAPSGESLGWPRSIGIVLLFGAALGSKEHTLVLPVLLLLADRFWNLGGLRRNRTLYGLMGAGALLGGVFVLQTLRQASTAGASVQGMTAAGYFFTQCRVIWSYVRMVVLPFGQNLDPDVAVSANLLDHGAIFGLLALVAVAAAAWIYRQKFPLAAFGVATFFLLLAPTSTFVPLQDVMAERRVYLPFLGLLLIAVEFLRHLKPANIGAVAGVLALACAVLTFQRSNVWSDPLSLWQDTVAKSPAKSRPRLQLAHAQYVQGICDQASESYSKASQIGPIDYPLLLNWGLALDCAGQSQQGVEKLNQAANLARNAHVMSQIGMLYAKQNKLPEAITALQQAEQLDPKFVMTYVYRGGVYELSGDKPAAIREYQRALALEPTNQPAQEGLARASR